ncbi:MAG: fumarylacetoacetate hydrolase family protein [Bacteroidia bacterium]
MKIICVGRNYAEHIKELNNVQNDEPVIFLKPDTAIPQRDMPFFYPSFSSDIHHEVEVVLKINKVGKNIAEKFAPKYYDELTVGIDFTARDLQSKLKSKGLPWELAKGFDGSAPIGTFIPKENFPDLSQIDFSLRINGELKQQGNTSMMLFSFDKIIAFVSSYITLKKGDLIFTGTPAGVGAVKIGDKLECFIGDEKLLEVNVK